jgi:hypothetical protein
MIGLLSVVRRFSASFGEVLSRCFEVFFLSPRLIPVCCLDAFLLGLNFGCADCAAAVESSGITLRKVVKGLIPGREPGCVRLRDWKDVVV